MNFKLILNTISTAATLFLCGSCSNSDTLDSPNNIEIPSNPPIPDNPENNFSDSQIIEMTQKDVLKYLRLFPVPSISISRLFTLYA